MMAKREQYGLFKMTVEVMGWTDDQIGGYVVPPDSLRAYIDEFASDGNLFLYEEFADRYIHERKDVGMEVMLARGRWAQVRDFNEASRLVRRHIEINDLGASQFSGGSIIKGGKKIGRVSYNGRVWDLKGEIIMESAA